MLLRGRRRSGWRRDWVHSVTLEDVAQETGLEALHSLVLDFDRDGKLIGVEVLAPRRTLRASTLDQAT